MKNDYYDMIVVGSSFASTFFLKKYLSKAPPKIKAYHLLPRKAHQSSIVEDMTGKSPPSPDYFIHKIDEN